MIIIFFFQFLQCCSQRTSIPRCNSESEILSWGFGTFKKNGDSEFNGKFHTTGPSMTTMRLHIQHCQFINFSQKSPLQCCCNPLIYLIYHLATSFCFWRWNWRSKAFTSRLLTTFKRLQLMLWTASYKMISNPATKGEKLTDASALCPMDLTLKGTAVFWTTKFVKLCLLFWHMCNNNTKTYNCGNLLCYMSINSHNDVRCRGGSGCTYLDMVERRNILLLLRPTP